MPFADVNGVRLYYEVHGEGEPLLAITGLGGDHLSWADQLPALRERFRTIMFDNRDSGRSSECAEGYKVSDLAHDTLALADWLELDDFHLLGVSLGGAIAQEVALAAPARVRTLTLAMTWGGDGHWGRVRGRLMANGAPHPARGARRAAPALVPLRGAVRGPRSGRPLPTEPMR
jgi:pimeloyl-ACP methyl ester carboxylesterase